jgi:hypothetical protein
MCPRISSASSATGCSTRSAPSPPRISATCARRRENYRENPAFDIEDAIREVGVGEAVTSMLENKGVPGMAERTLIRPPSSQLGPIDGHARGADRGMSPLAGKYETAIDRESAFEVLRARAEEAAREAEEAERREAEAEAMQEREFKAARRYTGEGVSRSTSRKRSSRSDSVATTFAKSFAGSSARNPGQALVRGVMGGLFRGR